MDEVADDPLILVADASACLDWGCGMVRSRVEVCEHFTAEKDASRYQGLLLLIDTRIGRKCR